MVFGLRIQLPGGTYRAILKSSNAVTDTKEDPELRHIWLRL